jgi:adenylate cyclase
VSALPKSIDRLLNLGVTPNMPLDLLLAVRGTNFIALAMSLVSVGGIIMALGGHDSAGFALAVGVCLVAYLGTLFLDGCGLYDAARFGFLTIACVHWAMVSVALGPRSGIRFGVVALIIYPLTGFARSEGRKTAIAYLIIAVSVVAAEVLTRRFGPLVAFSEKMLERVDYFLLASLAALCGFGIRYHQRAAASARLRLDEANQRIADLLANVLPAPIAARLEQHRGTIAESHAEATVLFADLTGFSALTRRLSSAHVVEILDMIFTRCDEASVRYGVEKIKTVGDCYMAASGVLDRAEGVAAVEAMADFGLEVLRIVEGAADEVGLSLGVRIGISTGTLISGVIGRRKYSFDVWGDTVNLAARMESAGVAGRIQVSEATYWRLRHAFDFEGRGPIALKGDHRAVAYLLVGRREGMPAQRAAR